MWLLLLDHKELETLPNNNACNGHIELTTPEENLRMRPNDQLTLEEEKLLLEYLGKGDMTGKS
jgi:hypothetical protein